MSFVHTHVHTQFSILESTIKIPELIAHAKTLGMSAIAITDSQNAFGLIQFSKACAKADVQPILGAQVNVRASSIVQPKQTDSLQQKAFRAPISLLVKTETGYQNLCRLLSLSYMAEKGPYVTAEQLKTYREGLVAIMPMENGEWIEYFRHNREADIEKSTEFYCTTYKDDFYVEIVRPVSYALLTAFEKTILAFQKSHNLQLVASNACRYLKPEDNFATTVLNAIRESTKIESPQEEYHRVGVRDVCTPEIMQERFNDLPMALASSLAIQKKCTFDFPFNKPDYKKTYHLPHPPTQDGESVKEAFIRECKEGLANRLNAHSDLSDEQNEKYIRRLDHEIDVITGMRFDGYFLIVMDFIRYAKSKGIPVGPGRGSGAGSLASYVLEITDLDPLEHDLLFERFLNPERISLPDFDIDFCMDRRPEVIQYVVEKYGKQRVAQIITFGKLQARMVLRDVGRVFGYSHKDMDRLSKLIPDVLGISLEEAVQKEPTLKNLISTQEDIALLFDVAMQLEGMIRHTSVHAAGLVIANDDLDRYCPLYLGRDAVVTTQLDMIDLEEIGLVKFDFLGLKTLTMLDKAERDIQAHHDPDFQFSNIKLTNRDVYKTLEEANTAGVFQLESPGMQELCKKLKPDSFEDITAINALFRPGPLGSGMVDDFIERKHGRKKIAYDLPQLEPILKSTYGVIVYQEQVQKIAVSLANYSLGAADILRRAMGKKKPEEMDKQRSRFMEGATQNNISSTKAKHIFDLMAMFAEYGFNKSHAAAYALLSYQTAFLKARYPAEFYASLLTIEINFSDKVKRYIDDARIQGITVLSPDVNISEKDFTVVDEKTVRFGLLGIKGLGVAALENILKERKKKPFTCLSNFCKRIDLQKVNRRVLEALVKSGSFDFVGIDRPILHVMIDEALTHAHYVKDKGLQNQSSLFEASESELDVEKKQAEGINATWDDLTLAGFERDHLGCYLTVHPFDSYEHIRKKLGMRPSEQLIDLPLNSTVSLFGIVTKIKPVTTRTGDSRMFVTCEDRESIFEVTCFFKNPEDSAGQSLLKTGQLYIFHGKTDRPYQKRFRMKVSEDTQVQRLDDHLSDGTRFNVHFSLSPERCESNALMRFKHILDTHRGLSPTSIHIRFPNKGNVYFKLATFPVSISPKFIEETKSLFGSEAVHIKYVREPHA